MPLKWEKFGDDMAELAEQWRKKRDANRRKKEEQDKAARRHLANLRKHNRQRRRVRFCQLCDSRFRPRNKKERYCVACREDLKAGKIINKRCADDSCPRCGASKSPKQYVCRTCMMLWNRGVFDRRVSIEDVAMGDGNGFVVIGGMRQNAKTLVPVSIYRQRLKHLERDRAEDEQCGAPLHNAVEGPVAGMDGCGPEVAGGERE